MARTVPSASCSRPASRDVESVDFGTKELECKSETESGRGTTNGETEDIAEMTCVEDDVELGEIKLSDNVPRGSCPTGRARGNAIKLSRRNSAAILSGGLKVEARKCIRASRAEDGGEGEGMGGVICKTCIDGTVVRSSESPGRTADDSIPTTLTVEAGLNETSL